MARYYLSSLDYKSLEKIRECRVEKIMKYKFFRHAGIAKINIPVSYDNKDYNEIVLISRHKGYDIVQIKEFPLFVYVCIFGRKICADEQKLHAQDLINIGCGELYPTEESAKKWKNTDII